MSDIQVADALLGMLIGGRYRVRERLARGGADAVYVAEDERLGRTVAVKVFQWGRGDAPAALDRFVEGAQAIARLTHPNVVAVYDQGTHQGLPYLVTEHVRGCTLREILQSRHRLTPVEALAIIEQVLAAVAAAHRRGLVHGDVNPGNILVANAPSGSTTDLLDSVVKVTDFGLARGGPVGGPAEGTAASAGYLAPELVDGAPGDPRSDVYAAGVVLSEMLTGRLPFEADNPGAAAVGTVGERPWAPPSRYVTGLPPAVDDLVVQAIRPDPADRPSDAGALLNEVQAIREQVTTSAAPPQAADATVVLSAVPAQATPTSPLPTSPGSGAPHPDRPTWARLPSPRTRPTGGSRRAGRDSRRGNSATSVLADGRRGGAPAVQWRRPVMIGLIGVLVLILASGGWWLGFGRWTQAPEVVGLPESEAVGLARQEGLRVQFAEPVYHDEVAADHVVSQEPTGRISKGGTLTLTLSKGPQVFPLPDVIGVDVEVATRQLESLGLTVIEGEADYSNTVPQGRVLAVEPEIGAPLRAGDEVTVSVSKGRAPIDVPDLLKMNIEQARGELERRNLQVVVEEVDSNEPAGTVVGQDPGAGSGLEAGDTVTLQVSKGPPTTPVPEVTGRRCQEAAQILTQAGFAVEFPLRERGTVLQQNPSAGTGLPPGAKVSIACV